MNFYGPGTGLVCIGTQQYNVCLFAFCVCELYGDSIGLSVGSGVGM